MGNTLRDFRRAIYTLRRKYGFGFALYRSTQTIDFRTGAKTTVRVKHRIKDGIILPTAAYRDYNYASLLSGTMPSQYEGIIDVTLRRIILDKKELPNDFILSTNDYFVINHQRYEIKQIAQMEVVNFISVVLKQVIGQQPFEVHEVYYDDFLDLKELLDGNEFGKQTVSVNVCSTPQSVVDYPYNPFLIYENLEEMENEL